MDVTVLVPTHPGRDDVCKRAMASVLAQSFPCRLHVEFDPGCTGAAETRNRALEKVTTDWVAFLDSDDEFKPNHIRACARHAVLTGADIVFPGYDTVGEDPVNCFGFPFDATLLRKRNYIPVTTLCRTEMVRAAGGFQPHPDEHGAPCEDWGLWLALVDLGAKFSHLPQRTWTWHVNPQPRTER